MISTLVLRTGDLHNFRDRHWDAAATLAFVGGLHEGVDLQGGFDRNRGDTRLEKFHIIFHERLVAVFLAAFHRSFGGHDGDAVAARAFAVVPVALHRAHAAVRPNAG